jgi:hypothetical protein
MNRRWLIPLVWGCLALAQPAMAEGSMGHLQQASAHAALASGHALVGTAKVASAVVAVPLKVVGAVGAASGRAGDALEDAAHADIGAPLPVTDEVVTAGPPPSEAL